jgi:hypothetical protein
VSDLAGISKTVSIVASSLVTKFLQKNLPHILKDVITTDILLLILNILQKFTVPQNHTIDSHKSLSTMTSVGIPGDVQAGSGGMCLSLCVSYGMLFIYEIARDILQISQSSIDTDKGSETSDLGRKWILSLVPLSSVHAPYSPPFPPSPQLQLILNESVPKNL